MYEGETELLKLIECVIWNIKCIFYLLSYGYFRGERDKNMELYITDITCYKIIVG